MHKTLQEAMEARIQDAAKMIKYSMEIRGWTKDRALTEYLANSAFGKASIERLKEILK